MHLTETQLTDFTAQRLAAEDLSALTQHLADCAACRQRAALRPSALYPALHRAVLIENEPVHLTFEQLADFVDGRLAGETQQFARDHLAQCQHCGAAVDDLRTFSQQVADELAVEIKPAAKAPPSLSERLREWFATPWLVTVSVTTALLIFGLLGWRMFKRDDQQVVIVPPAPTPVIKPSATVAPTAMPPNLLAQLNDGGATLGLDAAGNLQGAETWPPRYRQLVQTAWQTSRLPRSTALNGLGTASGSLMGSSSSKTLGAFRLLAPVKQVVATDRPTLRWQPLQGAESYEVEIVSEQYEPVLTSPAVSETVWQVPEALPRGRVYAWQAKAIKDGQRFKAPQPPAPLARFRIVGQKEFAEIQTAKARYGASHLLLGQLYAAAGLLDEPEREFRALQQANPTAALPKKLLAEVRQQAAR